ncbi:MAG: helix-turn-helix transcriptional regulator [Clostridia bacterium]|nr:helix-turn-helix transcriptional regulator [Clostridia bacterium]
MIYKMAGRQIKLLRHQHDLTQKDFAEKINSSQNYLSDVETGKKKPSLDYYITIANFFNVSLDQIFQDSLHVKKNVIIDNVILKMSYMDDEEQKLALKLIESVEDYARSKKSKE